MKMNTNTKNSSNGYDSPKLMIIGLDGATWVTLKPLIEAGVMKHMRYITEHASLGTLTSIIPPVTGPAWPVLATGLNPGRLGTYDFVNRVTLSNYTLLPVNSGMIRGKALWDYLSTKGYRVGVFAYPMMIPAYPINGWMIAGLGASKLHEWVWPKSMAEELEKAARPFTISLSYGLPKYKNNLPRLISDLDKMLSGHLSALDHLVRNHPVDILIAVFSITDLISHTMWHIWDKSHPRYSKEQSEEIWPQVEVLWKKLDDGIGLLLSNLHPQGHILFVSDHGFGPSHGVFHINTWLEQNNYLCRGNNLSGTNNKLRAALTSHLTPVLQPLFRKLQGTRAHHALRESILREIDLSRSKAFALETTDVCGMIFINRVYAQLHNLDEERFVMETANEIKDGLQGYSQRYKLPIEVFLSKDIYYGEYSQLAPELLFTVNDSRVSVSHRLQENAYENRLHHPMKTGNHRREGIFIGYGEKFRQGFYQESPLSILDVAPTAYHILDEPIPSHLDGRIRLDMFLPEYQVFLSKDLEGINLNNYSMPSLDVQDSEKMLQRLRDLGYID